MAILTASGRTALAMSLASRNIYLAWGSGLVGWDTTPVAENNNAVGLVTDIGRRKATSVQYVVPDENGDVSVPIFNAPGGSSVIEKFSVSNVPTSNLYMRFNFDFADASASVIREVAVFVDSVPIGGLPPGQKYFTNAEILEQGTLLALENLASKLTRSPTSRQSFEFVLAI